jgi:hypothetical protein
MDFNNNNKASRLNTIQLWEIFKSGNKQKSMMR